MKNGNSAMWFLSPKLLLWRNWSRLLQPMHKFINFTTFIFLHCRYLFFSRKSIKVCESYQIICFSVFNAEILISSGFFLALTTTRCLHAIFVAIIIIVIIFLSLRFSLVWRRVSIALKEMVIWQLQQKRMQSKQKEISK